MGSCLSKKNIHAKTPDVTLSKADPTKSIPQVPEEEALKNETFVVKHRKSDEAENVLKGAQVRTSSCTKEEVDAILIQCGRLSRSSSCELKNGSSNKGNRSCGSKRSFDFDYENENEDGRTGVAAERGSRHGNRHRSRTPSSPGQGRRRTPSREREQEEQHQQQQQQPGRSGSRERGGNGSGRRVSRSPGRRSDSPNTSSNGNRNSSKPQKMVSVPATVSSMAMDKSTNGDGGEGISAAAIKRIQVKRNVGGAGDAGTIGRARTAASPRARSPARNVQNQQQISLSRSNSRKNEQSPFRRNPLSDIDTNVVLEKMPVPGFKTPNNVTSQASAHKLNGDSETKLSTNVNVVNVIMAESLKPQGVARSRSSRLSRDLDINLQALTDANPSYTSLLLEDIQNFHQKSTNAAPTVTLPACVSKAHSILEAVADLNSSSFSNLSGKRRPLDDTGMRKLESKESVVKSKVVGDADDDLIHPSICNYVTVKRGSLEGSELEEQESSGSNSYVSGSQQHWVSSSSWEPTSADSTDRWTSGSSKDEEFNPLGFQRPENSTRRRVVVRRKDGDLQQNGIGRGRVGARYTTPTAATASS